MDFFGSPSRRESAETILSKMLADVPGTGRDHTLAQFYINDMTEQLRREGGAVVRPKTPPPTGRRAPKGGKDNGDDSVGASLSKASINNLLS